MVGVLVVVVAVGVVITQVSTNALLGTAVIQISAPSTITLGASTGIRANAEKCAWTSSNSAVVALSGFADIPGWSTANASGAGVGTATITAACIGGTASTTVNVVALAPTATLTCTNTPAPTLTLAATPLVDTAFNPGANGAAVHAIAVQPDGKIVVGGNFNTLAGQARHHLGRLNADGTLDTAFNPKPNGMVTALAAQLDGKLWVAGSFTVIAGQPVRFLVRLNPDGTLDKAPAFAGVGAIALQPDGKLLVVCGSLDGSQAYKYIWRLNSDGTPDGSITAFPRLAAGNSFNTILVQPDGRIVAGGDFSQVGFYNPQTSTYDPVSRNNLVRLNADMTLDTAFIAQTNGPVYALAAFSYSSRDSIMLGGAFTEVTGHVIGASSLDPTSTFIVFSFWSLDTATGDLDPPSELDVPLGGANRTVHALALRADGSVWGGGNFTRAPFTNLARLSASAVAVGNSVDGPVYALATQPDGTLLVGGAFTTVDGNPRSNLARIR
jgi:uncharacterized delta-60 repeat protein